MNKLFFISALVVLVAVISEHIITARLYNFHGPVQQRRGDEKRHYFEGSRPGYDSKRAEDEERRESERDREEGEKKRFYAYPEESEDFAVNERRW